MNKSENSSRTKIRSRKKQEKTNRKIPLEEKRKINKPTGKFKREAKSVSQKQQCFTQSLNKISIIGRKFASAHQIYSNNY